MRNWCLHKLAEHYYDESIEEMTHAEEEFDCVSYLNGVQEIVSCGVVDAGTSTAEQISFNFKLNPSE